MTREELKAHCERQIEMCETWAYGRGEKPRGKIYEEHKLILELLEQEPCGDAISKQAVLDMQYRIDDSATLSARNVINVDDIEDLPPVTLQWPRKGQWLRMSDLSEQEDDRYKCSHCGNVIHHKNKMNLYTFNSWCGRCGSDNGRK